MSRLTQLEIKISNADSFCHALKYAAKHGSLAIDFELIAVNGKNCVLEVEPYGSGMKLTLTEISEEEE